MAVAGAPSALISRSSLEVTAATAVAFLVGLRLALPMSVTNAIVLGLVFAPVWLSVLPRFDGAVTIMATFLAALAGGVLLTMLSALAGESDFGLARANAINYFSIFFGAGLLLWARSIIGLAPTAMLFSVGLVLTVSRTNPEVLANPWKFGYGVPVTLFLLAFALWLGASWMQYAALGLAGALAMVFDSRSFFAMVLLTAVLLIWQKLAHALAGRSLAFAVGGVVVAALVVYQAASSLAASGVLGAAAAERTIAQEQASGSLLLGGRPELSATWALFREYPLGFGIGSPPTLSQILVAKQGMVSIGYDPFNGYVERYMFGGRFELHSLMGDFWAHLGLIGLALILVVLVFAVRGLMAEIRSERASALVVLLFIMLVWNIAFSPLYTSIGATMAAIAFILRDRMAVQSLDLPQPELPPDTP